MMSVTVTNSDASLSDAVGMGSAADMAELMSAFSEASARLESTHRMLHAEVSRLKGELRQANERLERSRRLAALGEMAAGIAHEVRNPLGSIGLYAKMLDDDLVDRPLEQTIAQKISDAVRGLDGVVCDVLTFAKEIKVRCIGMDAGAMLDSAMASCEAYCRRVEGLSLERQWPENLEIVCDRSLVHQCLVNLIQNGIDAMVESQTRRPTISLEAFEEKIQEPDGTLLAMTALRITDNGPGVSENVLDRMFNPFFTTRHAGTGLGLAIVHRIIDAHGGRVWVSNRGEGGGQETGAIVTLLFPVEMAETVEETNLSADLQEMRS